MGRPVEGLAENDPFRNCWSWDIEVFQNCFTCTFVNMVDPSNIKQFVIHEDRNDAAEFCAFYRSCYGLIGYNSVKFDNVVVTTQLLLQEKAVAKMPGWMLAQRIYEFTQKLIEMERPPYIKPIVPQRDCYLIWHFDNEAKATSLKWVQVAIKWYNVEDMPVHHTAWITSDMIPTILDYNLNDAASTRQFYLDKCLKPVRMRKVLSKKYRLDFSNHNDPKIGEEIILSMVARKMKKDFWDVKQMRTERPVIHLKKVILPHIQFKSKEFNSVLEKFRGMSINTEFTRKKEDLPVLFDGMVYEFGLGGLHAARPNKIFEGVDSADVSSFYPNLSIQHGFYVAHLGEYFLEVYQDIFVERKVYPKGSPENTGLKLALNGSFGKTNSKYSGLYDPMVTMQITINGQLLLAMLCEELTLSGAATVIMANTDGIEVIVKDRELYEKICKEWEKLNRLELEHAKYKVLAIRDVNNYIAVKMNGETKEKGAYEVDKEIHKDQSMPIVAHAVREYFKTGVPVTETINKCEDIWMFMMAVRAKTGEFTLRSLDHWAGENTELVDQKAPKTIRYYIAKNGEALIKRTEKKDSKQHQKVYVKVINRFVDMPFEQYGVDKRFYIAEANKLIVGVTKQQAGSLFD